MSKVEERIIQKTKVPFDSKGFPLFADSFSCWRDSGKVTEKSLLRNGWVKLEEVLQILAEQKEKLQRFETWLEEREEKTNTEFREKGWGDTKLEITVVKEKFVELTEEEKYG